MMEITLTDNVLINVTRYTAGSQVSVDEALGADLVSRGLADGEEAAQEEEKAEPAVQAETKSTSRRAKT